MANFRMYSLLEKRDPLILTVRTGDGELIGSVFPR